MKSFPTSLLTEHRRSDVRDSGAIRVGVARQIPHSRRTTMSRLFDGYDLSGLSLRNRVVMAPMTRSRAANGVADSETALYYRQRAGAGLIVTEGSQISVEGRGYLLTPGIHTPEQVEGWAKVTRAVHEEGGRIFIQLWHVGRISHTTLQTNAESPVSSVDRPAVGSTARAYDAAGSPATVHVSRPRALTTFEISRVVKDFVRAATNAIAAGFDGVEIHGANGYLLEQFLNGALNTRVDRYGGVRIENRLRFVLETIDAVADAIGAAKTGLRLSPFGRIHDMQAYAGEEETWLTLAAQLAARKLAYVHLNDQHPFGPPALSANFLRKWRDVYPGTIVLAGGFDLHKGDQMISSGVADLIAFGRPFISNPDLVQRLANGLALAPIDRSNFYGGGPKGYTDYPVFDHSTST
ncbi:alkene reductase [Paraburkholderia youngii]|uniref:alkene reductase n=1 Tax=Paraburkholderia youngii TaxID=2782701 RepID=UPI003D1D61B8